MSEHNGHHCWNCWNVSLWIANDEPLYRFALECKEGVSLDRAARRFKAYVGDRTPDGASYSLKSIRAALAGLED